VSSFDEGVRAQNHSLQRRDFIVLQILKLKRTSKNLELDLDKCSSNAIPRFSAANGEFRSTT